MKYIWLTLFISGYASVFAQEIGRHILSTGGGISNTESHHLSWTIGDLIISTEYHDDGIFTQGFQQPHLFISEQENSSSDSFAAKVFPNPTQDQVEIVIENLDTELLIELFDLSGKLITQKKSQLPKESLDLSQLPSAQYLLRVSIPSQRTFRVFEILKVQ